MPATFIHNGDFIDHIPATDVPLGAVVVQGALVGIAQRPILAGALGSLALRGVYDVPVEGTTTAAVGTPLYWDTITKRASTNSGSGASAPLGVAVRAITDGDLLARVCINHWWMPWQ